MCSLPPEELLPLCGLQGELRAEQSEVLYAAAFSTGTDASVWSRIPGRT